MSRFKAYTFYKSDGTTQLLYGYNAEDALERSGYSLEWIAENIRDHRQGYGSPLEFVNGKWRPREIPKVEIKIQEPEQFNQN